MKYLHKSSSRLPVFTASDGCRLSEVIHPANDGTSQDVSLARASLGPGAQTKPHKLEFVEIYYVISGRGIMHVGADQVEVGPGSCVYLPAHTEQWLQNPSDSEPIVFLCVCSPAYDPGLDHLSPGE